VAKEGVLENEYDMAKEAADRAQDQAAKFGQKAVEAIDSRRTGAASGLENAAAGIHSKADSLPGGEKVSGFAHQAADTMSGTAQYLRDHDVKDMASDLQKFVENHPLPAIIGAAVVGFLAGRAARS
jgi:ElaB/YqjD/DUF883 family membrane-anchored ribosome-binding protein